ncbi:MAG: DUF4349 domain-containing protein [Coriobacteriia bacterium]|nr:DUF4349 domain-containing protein [Coriobacteriia bacterium]
MKKTKFLLLALLAVLLLAIGVAGCTAPMTATDSADEWAAGSESLGLLSDDSAGIGGVQRYSYMTEEEFDSLDSIESATSVVPPAGGGAPTDADRMLIRSATARLETKDFDQSRTAIETALSAAGGFTQDSELSGDGSADNLRTYHAVLRVPQDQFDRFVEGVTAQGNLLSLTKSGDDVTDAFFDREARIKILETEETELLAIMEGADDVADVFRIRDRVSEIRIDIERLRGENIRTESLVTMSTVTLTLTEVQTITPIEEDGFLTRAGHTFTVSINAFVLFMQGLALVLIAIAPFALLLAAIVAVIWVLVRRSIKKRKKKLEQLPQPPLPTEPSPISSASEFQNAPPVEPPLGSPPPSMQ